MIQSQKLFSTVRMSLLYEKNSCQPVMGGGHCFRVQCRDLVRAVAWTELRHLQELPLEAEQHSWYRVRPRIKMENATQGMKKNIFAAGIFTAGSYRCLCDHETVDPEEHWRIAVRDIYRKNFSTARPGKLSKMKKRAHAHDIFVIICVS
jgi:hypothetical protein